MDQDELIRMLNSGNKGQYNQALNIIIIYVKKNFNGWKKLDDGEIDDIVQETIFEFAQKIDKNGTDLLKSNIRAYIFGILRIKCLEFYRKRRIRREFPGLFDFNIEDTNTENEDESEKEALIEKIAANLHALTPECQELLQLYYWKDLSHLEILELMPELLNENNCRQRKFSCLKMLKKILGSKKQK